MTRTRKTSGAALALCGILGLSCASPRAQEPKQQFDIPAGNAGVRLNELFSQLGLSLVCDFAATGVATTHEVHGVYTLKEALARMVAGQNIRFWFASERTVSCGLRKERKRVAAAGPEPTRTASLPSPIDEVVVTGTHLHGRSPVGTEIISLSRGDIDRMAFGTLHQVIGTLPQIFGGGPSEDTFQIGRETATNVGRGSGLNLRGLGAGSTLLLVNGRRIAPGGSEAAFIDAFNIPLSAVERIDVMPDGGSALYGSNAVGGVINVVLRHGETTNETWARAARAEDGVLGERIFSQTYARQWEGGNGLLSVDYYHQDPLPASARRQTDSDLTAFGGYDFDTQQSNPGTISLGNQTWAIPRGQNGTALTSADLQAGTRNQESLFRGADMVASQRRLAAVANIQESLSDRLTVYLDGFWTRRNARQDQPGARMDLTVTSANPFYINPLGGSGPIVVSYDFIDDLGPVTTFAQVDTSNLSLGGDFDLGNGFFLRGYAAQAQDREKSRQDNLLDPNALRIALASSDVATAFNPFGDGSSTSPAVVQNLRATGSFLSRSTVQSGHLFVDGPLPSLGGVTAKSALGIDVRRQIFTTFTTDTRTGALPSGHFERNVFATFAELSLPIVGLANRRRGLESLEFSIAASQEHNSDIHDSSTMPKLGMSWSPLQSLRLRTTWTRAVRAPNLPDLDESQNRSTITMLRDGSSATRTLLWVGNNTALRPEHGSAFTVGADLALPSTSVALTYFDIDIVDRVQNHTATPDLLLNPQTADLIIRHPSSAQQQAVCSRSNFLGIAGTCMTTPIDAIVDLRLSNSALTRTSGIDLITRRRWDSPSGHWEVGLNATYTLDFSEQTSPLAPVRDLLDTQSNPLALQSRGLVAWSGNHLATSAWINYTGSYKDTFSQPQRRVTSWTTADVVVQWTVGDKPKDAEVLFGIQNILDAYPPFLNNRLGIGYDAENADMRGRFMSVQLRKHW